MGNVEDEKAMHRQWGIQTLTVLVSTPPTSNSSFARILLKACLNLYNYLDTGIQLYIDITFA